MPDSDYARWQRETYEPAVRRFPERKPSFLTESDLEVAPLYGPDAQDAEPLGQPGEFPFTRGVQPSMYRGRLWTMRQYAGFSTPEDSNARYRFLLSQGQTGLSVAFDLPTQTGYDADHEMARPEIGKVGVPISSLADMEVLFDGIPLEDITTSMTINSTAPMLLALYLSVARKQGVAFGEVGGTTQNDVLKEYIARGTHIFPPRAVAPPRDGHVRVLRLGRSAMEHDQHQRISHARGRGDRSAGDRVYARQRHSVRAGGGGRRPQRG